MDRFVTRSLWGFDRFVTRSLCGARCGCNWFAMRKLGYYRIDFSFGGTWSNRPVQDEILIDAVQQASSMCRHSFTDKTHTSFSTHLKKKKQKGKKKKLIIT